MKLKAPFVYPGGKSLAVDHVWSELGTPKVYVEPFAGSLAMLLGAPYEHSQVTEIVNDASGLVVNFWRAVRHDPDYVSRIMDRPCMEPDLTSMKLACIAQQSALPGRLSAHPEWCDPKLAAWWALAVSGSIMGRLGAGVWWDGGTGVLSNDAPRGLGTPSEKPALGRGAFGRNASSDIRNIISQLSHRLRNVNILCGDWSRVVTESYTAVGGSRYASIFLDPPYSTSSEIYDGSANNVADDVRQWCVSNGESKRIVLCGYLQEHDELLGYGWAKKEWTSRSGLTKTAVGSSHSGTRERLWISPACRGNEDLKLDMA